MKNIVIIGLGLIGGSLAAALKGFEGYTVVGVDTDKDTRAHAMANGMADTVADDAEAAVQTGDVVFCCLHPLATLDFLRAHAGHFKAGALVTDVCGVKAAVMEAAACLPGYVDFIGGHPMAGKERGGIANAGKDLFRGAHYIITPRQDSRPENIAFMERISGHIGCRDLVKTTPEHHDKIIAYTSQIMHIMAVAICDDPFMFQCQGFEGGSFRDCTRVAALDPKLWAELFSMNKNALTACITRLEDSLKVYRESIEKADVPKLEEKLTHSSDRKKKMNIEHRRGDDAL